MSIKLKNLGEYIVVLKVPGTQTTNGGAVVAVSEPIPFDGQIKAIWGVLGTAGTTSSQTTDVQKNGATMLSSGAMLTFATTSTTPTYLNANLSADPTSVTQGDILSLKTTAINTTPGLDLVVAITIQRKRGTGPVSAMLTGSYGPVVA